MQQARIETVRQPTAPRAEELDEAMIGNLVRHFYDRVHDDALLGPMFRVTVPDWEQHLGMVTDFWSQVLLGTGRYRGCVMGAHGPLRMKPAHFDRWMALFRASAEENLPPAACRRALDAAGAPQIYEDELNHVHLLK